MTEATQFATEDRLRTDRQMLFILLAHIPVVALLVPAGFDTYGFAIGASLLAGAITGISYGLLRGSRALSVVFAAGLMVFSAIMIQAQMGRIEMHFHIFAAMALLIIYRDWLPVVTAAAVIAAHHLIFTGLQMSGISIFDIPVTIFNHEVSWSVTFVHAAFVVFEAGILVFFAIRMGQERKQSLQIIEVVQNFDAQKDLTGRIEGAGKDVTAASFNSMMARFEALIAMVRDLSGRLSASARSLKAVSVHSADIVNDQQQQTDQAAAAMNQMAATIQEVAQNAQAASESAVQASEASTAGTGNVDEAVRLTESTNTALEDSARMVQELVDKVQSIASVIGSISDISDQTNLLALNAAIEAARAGEHGRGFAVVADEVRTLSRRTQAFTDEIRTTIGELTGVSEGSLAAIEIGQTRSRETTYAIRKAGEALALIEKAITEVGGMNQQIAAASEQQATVSSEINENIQRVAGQSTDVVSEVGKAGAMAAELESLVDEVNDLVGEYRTS
ncbi:methyl-accepting chemotaxis protein [Marinobacter panjinensis]|uniref:Methyl-accepting chemotaxis protein n=1 Tax=Marinobacter panjinensis TaxID=2576384 RepID=A0A4U6R4B9_9GAMM|nr:methyl-accepting chemotaxis protein [Marinobacter panjinensis]MCR8914520.1 methyl-accepting chemotaxis protein [Marinobacter panjinensis]TKV68654.1 methyl-accepting chemotaxis protein [Marinobacter panjinensis]